MGNLRGASTAILVVILIAVLHQPTGSEASGPDDVTAGNSTTNSTTDKGSDGTKVDHKEVERLKALYVKALAAEERSQAANEKHCKDLGGSCKHNTLNDTCCLKCDGGSGKQRVCFPLDICETPPFSCSKLGNSWQLGGAKSDKCCFPTVGVNEGLEGLGCCVKLPCAIPLP